MLQQANHVADLVNAKMGFRLKVSVSYMNSVYCRDFTLGRKIGSDARPTESANTYQRKGIGLDVQRLLSANRAANITKIIPVVRSIEVTTFSRRSTPARGCVAPIKIDDQIRPITR